ncbi:SipW-dependent-type signal peptide-containing protein [Microbacterium sp. 179-I 3D4 NHS]|uniref:SipW-dependent-type signal peptide-containing protein n=1 Tax=Microbacterium sp. 179-I 3D4 NHS TaxID=3142381 RepID=UPI00399F25A0
MRTRRAEREAKRLRSRRIRAALAGGLVFGVGAAMTLAAWTDSENAGASFTAGRFDIVGAPDGVSFSSHPSPGAPSALSFAVAPTALAPGTTTYALFSVRTANPSIAGTLQLTAGTPTGTGLAAHLTYGARTIGASTSCTATTYGTGTVVVPDGSALTVGATGTQAVAANGASQVNYCLAVTLPTTASNTAQGLTMTQVWQVVGTSS